VSRTRLADFLQSHLFWAFDASSAGVPVFNPLFGFSKISAPEISAELETFKDGTFVYNRSVVKGGSVSPVVFERAASMFDVDFYDWIMFTLHGNKDFEDGGTLGKIGSEISNFLGGTPPSPRRNLLIVQFSSLNLAALAPTDEGSSGLRITGSVALGALAGIAAGASNKAVFGGAAFGAGAALAGVGPFAFAMRLPARAWMLHNCLPVRYKSASDFDASSPNISLQELEVQPEYIEEFSLGQKP
jgi:phage tail-like protein